MAKFNAEGIDGLELSLAEIEALPEDVVCEILDAGADVVVAEQKRVLKSMGLYKSHALHDSVQGFRKVGKVDGSKKRYVMIYPYGTRRFYNRKLQEKIGYGHKYRKARAYTVGGDRKAVTNNDVGFIHEFGAPRKGIQAKQWMRKANINAAEAMAAAEFSVYDRWLKSKDL